MPIPIDIIYERQWSSLNNLVFTLTHLGRMGRLYGGFPKFRYIRAGIPANIVRTFPIASLWNFAAAKLRLPSPFFLNEPRWIGEWVAKQRDLSPIVLANGTAHRFLFPLLKESSRSLILERGSMYPTLFFQLSQKARREAGYPATDKLPPEILDEMEKTKLADYVLAGSQMVRQSYIDYGFPADKVFDCSYGIDISAFPFAKRLPAVNRPIRIGVVGVIGFRKGLFRIIRIGEWASRRGQPVEIHFAGPIQDTESNEMFAKSQVNFHLHGTIKGKQLIAFLNSCDLYLLPSYEEGLPFSVLEAMSTGLGAIISNDTGAREAIEDGISGINLSSFYDDEFDTKLLPILRSPDGIMEMGYAARKRIENLYTLDHYLLRLSSALEQIS